MVDAMALTDDDGLNALDSRHLEAVSRLTKLQQYKKNVIEKVY